MINNFMDGLRNVINGLVERRSALRGNDYVSEKALADSTRRAVFRTGIGNKIVRLKSGGALDDTIQFDSTADAEFYKQRLAAKVKQAVKWSLVFGRGVIIITHGKNDDPTKPLRPAADPKGYKFSVFSGDLVQPQTVELDLSSERYYKPNYYNVRGVSFHHSRVISFEYVQPPEYEAPDFKYGGISEFDLIYNQLVSDGVVERASASIVEKASTFIYKVTGFKNALRAKKDKEVIDYFSKIEDVRSIYGAVLLDQEDDATAVQQQLTNLADVNEMTLRRLAMVTGIPLPWLIGENVRGMNATGENERQIYQDMLETLQSDYILEPLQQLANLVGFGPVDFKENQGETPTARIEFETKAIDNAVKLQLLGEDYGRYLEDKGVIVADDWADLFADPTDDSSEPDATSEPEPTDGGELNVDPTSSLNGAQVTAILDIIERIRTGDISKSTARKVIATSFPVSESEADALIADVPEPPAEALPNATPDQQE